MTEPDRAYSAILALRVVLVAEGVGALGIALHSGGALEQVLAALALGAALVVAFGGTTRAAYVVAACFVFAALDTTFAGQDPFGYLAIPAHATRYGVALAVVFPDRAKLILRAATSLTFAAHGLEAIGLHPDFVDYIQHTGGLVGLDLSAPVTVTMLRVIGGVDLVVAALVLLLARRKAKVAVAGYMTFWGTVTAFARTVYAGPAGLPDTLIRAANAGAPLALALLWRRER